MKRPSLFTILIVIGLIVVVTFGLRYTGGMWAPTTYDGGLTFAGMPELLDSQGNRMPDEVTKEFFEICGKLRSTTRYIHEDRGDGYVTLRYPETEDSDHITLYPKFGVVFHGWWIDAKYHSMVGRRAPCFELSEEIARFIETHKLKSPADD